MGKTLSVFLLESGFFSALGTTEDCGGLKKLVTRGTANTHDYNNGVVVVYDEVGRPWILHHSLFKEAVKGGLQDFSLKRGAFVPHSNDGGGFILEVAMKL